MDERVVYLMLNWIELADDIIHAGVVPGPPHHWYQNSVWVGTKEMISLLTLLGVLIAIATFYRNSRVRKFDITLQAIDFYNHEIRDAINDFSDSFNESLVDNKFQGKDINTAMIIVAKNLDIRKVIHLLDELGFYFTNRNINSFQVKAVISSELIAFLRDRKYRKLINHFVSQSNLIGIQNLYENIGLENGSDQNGSKDTHI
ncbi:hypothetical protein FC85_GL002577 [Lentilactobacillus diolivorans DSM 14421]|uniref:Uncharacterized protein n=2 Tax=Lentilactobacillus diolivorans TaxID=179838 RepID=A0A0R1SG26_9LACO|nr:hypothetical protein FC85_GL002577 [Lentilactobacillus diolivorans DSM 14421]